MVMFCTSVNFLFTYTYEKNHPCCLSACMGIWDGCLPARQTDQATARQKAPNIIFILTDDLGYGDLGVLFQNQRAATGKPYHQTPHLDRMSAKASC
jgi:hypothetical protein